MRRAALLLWGLLAGGALAPCCSAAQATAAGGLPGHAGVATAHPAATAAGLEVLREGGNAFDAAVAISAALAVVEPTGSGLTGGGIYLLHRQSDGFEVAIDAREKAPGAATRDMYLDASGNPVPGLSTQSALAAGIPGEPAGLALLAARYGKLPVAKSLAPAIRLARKGFPLSPRLHDALVAMRDKFAATPAVAKNFLRKGAVPPLGTVITQPELARTLQWLADHGLASFYSGAMATRLVDAIRAQGGIWTEADLAAYQAQERAPIVGHFHGARIVSAPPPSSGGIALVEALNILSQFDLQHADSAERKHLLIEAERRALRDRAVYLGDPDFVSIPQALLTSPDYAAGLAASIRTDRATPSASLPGVGAGAAQGPQTTHFSVIDRDGNRVAATITLNFAFGSGRMLGDTGLFLNDEMDDFSVKPGVPNGYGLVGAAANAIAPNKRMLSSVTPTFVDTADRTLVVGSPGGSLITGMVLLATLNFLDGESAQQIVSAPRIHNQYLPDELRYEPGALSADEISALTARGQHLVQTPRWGNMQAVIWNRAQGTVEAASDPRGDGSGQVQ
ncbi:MAG TPA: gamma-glutamyltransferase [Steroidobacteraceae bacterium]|nr:gamma-glutamyltransferase [Steroidobacteraceae bacterium]